MALCKKCGAEVSEDAELCEACKAAEAKAEAATAAEEKTQDNGQIDIGAKLQELNDTVDTTADFDPDDIANNKIVAVLAYLGILVLIPILAAPKSKFARFHANQGLVLLIVDIIYSIISYIIGAIVPILGTLLDVVSIVFFVLMIIGIINAANGKAKELPIIGRILLLK